MMDHQNEREPAEAFRDFLFERHDRSVSVNQLSEEQPRLTRSFLSR